MDSPIARAPIRKVCVLSHTPTASLIFFQAHPVFLTVIWMTPRSISNKPSPGDFLMGNLSAGNLIQGILGFFKMCF